MSSVSISALVWLEPQMSELPQISDWAGIELLPQIKAEPLGPPLLAWNTLLP